MAQFILAVVDDTWVRELCDTKTLYTDVVPKALLYHLQLGCTVCHALEILVLHNEMQRYHIKVEGIPDYINILKDAQKLAGRANQMIADKTLHLFTSTAMLTTEIFPQTNNDWEDRVEADKTWTECKAAYKKAHAKVRIKVQANKGSIKFTVANAAVRVENTH